MIEKDQCFLAVKKILQNTETNGYSIQDIHPKDNSELLPLEIERQMGIEERIKLEKEKVLAVQSILCEDADIKDETTEENIAQHVPIVTKDLTQIEKYLEDNTQENNNQRFGFYTETKSENDNNQIVTNNIEKYDYIIDKNLDKVLQDEDIKEFPLDNLLLTPKGV